MNSQPYSSRSLTQRYKFLLPGWKQVIQIMLGEKPGIFYANSLYIIQLIEANFNVYLHIMWSQKIMPHASKHNLIPSEKYAQPRSQCISVAIHKVLIFDLIRRSRYNATVFNNDVCTCYDSIIPVLAALALMSVGSNIQAVQFLLTFLEEAKYFATAKNNTSQRHFLHTAAKSIYGVLQGSGLASSLWLLLSLILLHTYTENTKNNTITMPSKQQL